MNWDRSYDRLIAKQCEGKTVHLGNANWPEGGFAGMQTNPFDYYWVHIEADGSGHHPVAVSHYNTDPAACHRAAEAWRKQKPGRYYVITSACEFEDIPSRVTLFDRDEAWKAAYVVTKAPTLHEALLAACEKEEK